TQGQSLQRQEVRPGAELPDPYFPAFPGLSEVHADRGDLAIGTDSAHPGWVGMLQGLHFLSRGNFHNVYAPIFAAEGQVFSIRAEQGLAQAVLEHEHFLAGLAVPQFSTRRRFQIARRKFCGKEAACQPAAIGAYADERDSGFNNEIVYSLRKNLLAGPGVPNLQEGSAVLLLGIALDAESPHASVA